jgi:hypothetical protein
MSTMDLDDAVSIAVDLGLPKDRSTIRRVVRANDIARRDLARLTADFGKERIYLVTSQTDPTTIYTVLRNGSFKCTCPFAQNKALPCKHAIAVMMGERREFEVAQVAAWEEEEANRFACCGEEDFVLT